MLKIKDNIDLDILIAKYGFRKRYDEENGKLIYLIREYTCHIWSTYTIEIRLENRFIYFTEYGKHRYYDGKQKCYAFMELFDFIYDLINAGLVEKVDD